MTVFLFSSGAWLRVEGVACKKMWCILRFDQEGRFRDLSSSVSLSLSLVVDGWRFSLFVCFMRPQMVTAVLECCHGYLFNVTLANDFQIARSLRNEPGISYKMRKGNVQEIWCKAKWQHQTKRFYIGCCSQFLVVTLERVYAFLYWRPWCWRWDQAKNEKKQAMAGVGLTERKSHSLQR